MSDVKIDQHGQLLNSCIARARLVDRQIDELIGVCKGVLADGMLFKEEADFLLCWLEMNRQVADKWPANILYGRLLSAVEDGIIDPDEEKDLIETLMDITGGVVDPSTHQLQSSQLPLDDPPPPVMFSGKLFCATGRFVSGTRGSIVALINQSGGSYKNTVVKKTDYLVIGELSSRDWIHSSFGRKIEKALDMRKAGGKVKILSERHMLDSANV